MAHFRMKRGLTRLRKNELDPQVRPQPEISSPFFSMRNDHRFSSCILATFLFF